MNDFIGVYENALPDHICDIAVRKVEKKCEMKGDSYIFCDEKFRKDDHVIIPVYGETTAGFNRLRTDVVSHLKPCFENYEQKYDLKVRFSDVLYDIFKFQRSLPGGGFHKWHHERGKQPIYSERFLAWMFYLNDVDETGTTDFLYQERSIQPKKGTCVIFPADFTHTHRANPNLNQAKYIITGWFSYQN